MASRSSEFTVFELPGSAYPSLQAAQENAVKGLATSLAETLRSLLADGWLIIADGQIVPNPERPL